MKKTLSLVLVLALALSLCVPALAISSTVSITSASATTAGVTVKGTTEGVKAAVAVQVLDASGNLLGMESFVVSNDAFNGTMKLKLTAGTTYTVRAADYDGSAWATTTATVPVPDDPAPSTPSTPKTETVTLPESEDEGALPVQAEIKGETATVAPITDEALAEMTGEDTAETLTMDFSALDTPVTTAAIPTETMQKLADVLADEESTAENLTIALADGEVTFDAQALAAAVEQAEGATLELSVDLNAPLSDEQKAVVADMENALVVSVTLTSNGEEIHDFNGGSATIAIPYTLKEGQDPTKLSVWFVDESGKLTEVPAVYDAKTGTVIFVVAHFSEYVIGVDEKKLVACLKNDTCPMAAFSDLKLTAWYHDGVHYCLESKLMDGVGGGKFDPSGKTTRGQVITILWRLKDKPYVNYAMAFTDVKAGKYYTEAVRWGASLKIVTGKSKTVFDPNAPITREDFAVMLYRFAKAEGLDVTAEKSFDSFTDAAQVHKYAVKAMSWAVAEGIISGEGNRLKPTADTSRTEAATMFMRFCKNVMD